MTTEKNGDGIRLLSTVLICITIVAAGYFLSQTDYYIQNTGANTPVNNTLSNTIAVSGDGKVYATPDMVKLNISSSEVASTTKDAQTQVNKKIAQVLDILKQNDVASEDIQTTEESLYPEYDYVLGFNHLKGQRATQRINVSIKKITPEAEKVSKIIDAIAKVDKIQMDSIQFDIEDKTPFYSKAREMAYNRAEQKAVELSKLGHVDLLKPVSIQDSTTEVYPPRPIYDAVAKVDMAMENSGGVSLPSGQMEVDVQVNVMFGIK